MELLQKIKKWQIIAAFLVSLFGLYAGATSIGLNLPRPAWISEVHAAERLTNGVQIRMEQLHLESLRRSWNDVVSRIAELEAKGVAVPNKLLIQERDLSTQITSQREYVRDLRSQR